MTKKRIVGGPSTLVGLIAHFRENSDGAPHENVLPQGVWDYSDIPEKEWDYDSWEIPGGACYAVIRVSAKGVHWSLFNETNDVAAWGGHGGRTMNFNEFELMSDEDSNTPVETLNEVRAYIQAHRKPLA